MNDLLMLFLHSLLISVSTFGGGSQALFYQFGVVETAWITSADLSAVLALGYATPGPAVFTAATFIGYSRHGLLGAVVGTIGIFTIPTVTSILAARYLAPLTKNPHAKYFTKCVGLIAAGLVAATALLVLDYTAAANWQFMIAALSFVVSLKYSLNSILILLTGVVIGLLFT